MTIQYRAIMKEYKVELDNPILDPSFVSKVKTFEEKMANNQLTDEEIKAEDEELVKLFKELHELLEDDSDQVKKLKYQTDIANAKATIAETEDKAALIKLQKEFKDMPEVQPLIAKKLDAIAAIEKKRDDDEKLAKIIKDGKAEIGDAKYEELQAMGEKYKEYPELVAIVNKRHADEKPDPDKDKKAIAEKLRTKKEWSYKDLEAIGIKPTGNDMTVEGVRLEKEQYFNIYSVRK